VSAQPSGGPSLFDLLEQRLREHYASTLPRNVGYPRAVANAILGGINLPFEAGRHVAGDVVGSMYAASSGQSDNPLDQRIAEAYRAGGPAASLAAARTDPRKEVSLTAGALTELLNPTNYAGSGVLPRLGRVGELADVALTTPFRPLEVALGQVGRRAVGPAVLRARQALYGPVEGVAGNVPKSAGLLGPVPPPPLRTPPPLEPAGAPSIIDLARGAPIRPAVPKAAPLPEGLAPTRTPSLVGLARQRGRAAEAEVAQRVTPAQERAAADVESLAPAPSAPQEAVQRPTAPSEAAPADLAPTTREAGLAALSGRDTNTLLSVAYDHPNAVANAQRKYADVGALRARAIERIQADRGRVARLAAADPDLAARVAALPDAEAAGEVRKATQLSAPEVPVPPAAAPGTLTADQDAAVTKLLGYHPNVTGDRPMWDALRQTAIDRGIPAEAIDRAAAAVPITSGESEQFMADPALIRERIAEMEASPEGQLFKYINPGGKFKLVDTRTGARIAVREGGAFREAIESPWNIPGTHYDEVAQAALSSRLSPEAVDRTDLDAFFERARQLWRERQHLRAQLRGEATGGGMMVVTPLAAARTLGTGAAEAAGRALSNLGLTGTDLKAAGSAFGQAMRESRQSAAEGIGTRAQAEAAGLGRYVSGPRGPGQAVGDFQNQMRSNVVATFKNQLLDVLHTRAMAREFSPTGSDPAGTLDRIADELRANEAAPDAYGRLSDTLRAAQERWGFKGYVPDLGQGQVGALAQEEPGRVLPATQRVINGMVMELRTKGPVGLLTFPVGGARGYFQPGIDAFFQRINRAPQRGGREGLYTLTGDANSWLAAHTFLGDLARRGVDVTPLAGQAFTPEQVEAVAGTQAANEWRSLLATVWGGAEAETKRVLGDFGQKTALEKVPLIGRMFWLAGWSQRMLPIYAQVAARHPGVSMAVGGALANQAQGLKAQGLNPWDVGGVDTPLGRVNLLSPMPFSGELAGEALSALGGQEGEAKTPYQTFEGLAGGLGLPINPLIGTVANIAGWTPRRPGDLDRYAGVENALIGKGLGAIGLPSPTLQDVGGQGADYGHLIDRAREIVTGLEAGDLKAGKKAPASEADKEFARLVYERTGLPLADPRNIGAVIDSLADDPDTLAAKWRKEAEANVAGRQGKQGVVSAVSPLTVSRIDPLARQANLGRTNQPYSYEQISAAYDAGQKKVAQQMTKANAASKAPNQRVYEGASEAQRAAAVKSWLYNVEHPTTVPLETNMYGLRRTGGGADLSGLRRR
jgi:hypothetical protein